MAAGVALRSSQESVPREWIDPDTGHRVVRLSDEPGSQSLHFTSTLTRPTARTSSSRHRQRVGDRSEDAAIEKVIDGRVSLLDDGRKTDAHYVRMVWYATDPGNKASRDRQGPATAQS
jgi:oligogalacturonide lyase